jgi:hypothetical protein
VHPPQDTPASSEPAAPRAQGRLRRLLLVALLVAGLAAAGAFSYGLLVYDRATRPDRSAPDVAVNNYLLALLVERDDVRASLFTCRDGAQLDGIRAFRDEMVSRERSLGVSIMVNVALGATVERNERDATVIATVARSAVIDGVPQSVTDQWRMRAVNRNGWRVCGAERLTA